MCVHSVKYTLVFETHDLNKDFALILGYLTTLFQR